MEKRPRKPRIAHKIKNNKGTSFPQYVIFFDTETKEKDIAINTKELSLKLGVAYLTRYYKGKGYLKESECVFYTRAQFEKWINKTCTGKKRFIITAHNVGFDVRITGIMKRLVKNGWKRNSFILDEHKFMAALRKDNTSIFIMDNMQLFNVSLKSLGESIGISKLEVDFETADDNSLLTYCKRDVEVMRVAWSKWSTFIQEFDLGNFKATIGSQAFTAFKHRFKENDIYIHTNERVIELERESYHGGRVECFYIGKYDSSSIYNLDVNSMYPYIMKTVKLPYKLIAYYEKISLNDFKRIHNNTNYICEATVKITRPLLPALNNGRLIFPVGNVSGVWTKSELEYAMRNGKLLDVRRCAIYAEAILFKDYVDFFYAQRLQFKKEGNTQFAYFAKLLMNSLYGKFGQKMTEYEVTGFNPDLPDQGGSTYDLFKRMQVKYRVIDGIIEKESGTFEGYDSFVAVAAAITGAARAYLLSLIEIAGWDNVLYCDTDSLFVNKKGRSNLSSVINNIAIGKLKVEAVADSITILGAKRYIFGSKVANKGIRKDAVRITKNTYSQVQFESFAASINSGHSNNVRIKQIIKTLSNNYTKGTVNSSGRVSPLVYSQ